MRAFSVILGVFGLAGCGQHASPAGQAGTEAAPPPAGGSQSPPVTPPPPPPPPAPTARTDAAVPVFTIGDRRFIELARWLETPGLPDGTNLEAWGAGPVASPGAAGGWDRLQAASSAPAAWRAATGTVLPAYAADGTLCSATVGDLALLGFNTNDGFDGAPVLVAEVVRQRDCVPVLVTNRPAPRFFTAAGEPSAAQGRQVTTAVGKLKAARAHRGATPALTRFTGAAGTTLVLATIEESEPGPGDCGEHHVAFRALFELPATGAPTLRGTSAEFFGAAPLTALVDSDGDGTIEALYDGAQFDLGMEMRRDFVGVLPLASTPAPADRLTFTTYGGCD